MAVLSTDLWGVFRFPILDVSFDMESPRFDLGLRAVGIDGGAVILPLCWPWSAARSPTLVFDRLGRSMAAASGERTRRWGDNVAGSVEIA